MNAYDNTDLYTDEEFLANIVLIKEISMLIGWLRAILKDRHLGEPMPAWTLVDFKYFYLNNIEKRNRIKDAISKLRNKHKQLNELLSSKEIA